MVKTNMYKSILTAIVITIMSVASSYAQKWQPGYFIDAKGNKSVGLIRTNPGGTGPFKNEGFIEFKDGEKTNPYKLSTSDLQSFVVEKDSFVVAHAPGNETWAKKDFDFVKVVVNEPTKIYATRGAGKGGSGSGFRVSPGIGLSTGGGSAMGGGLGISFGGGGNGNRGGGKSVVSYYYGENTASMQHLTNENFIDIMSEVMGDEPEVVEQIRAGKFGLRNLDKLVEYFNEAKASHQ